MIVEDIIYPEGSRTGIAWAEFRHTWYVKEYPSLRHEVPVDDAEQVLQYYLSTGQRLGHSPNPWFDESWYRQLYPEVAAFVREGRYRSGFDEYCQVGHAGRTPHWLYNDYIYRVSGAELPPEAIHSAGLANHYDHYLRLGSRDGRCAHLLFDAAFYRAQLDEVEAGEAQRLGAYRHFLLRIADGKSEVRTAVYFDPAWYRRNNPLTVEGSGARWTCALHHYLTNTTAAAFDPLPDFSETAYLERYPDVAASVDSGDLRNGYQHFLSNGVFELRSPSDVVNLRHYFDANDTVREDLENRKARDAFAHFLQIGREKGLAYGSVFDETEEERQAKALFRTKAENLLPLFGRQPLDFTAAAVRELSVIMVLHNNFALTMQSLASLRQNYGKAIELILVDSGSTDDTRCITRYVRGAHVLRLDSNLGFVPGCNAALQIVNGSAVLFLNNDTELAPNAVSAALRRLSSDTQIGAVGGKVIRTHGRLQEAGNIIWRDGTTHGYLRNASPGAPEANFVRDVDYCSGAFLLVRTDLLRKLGGFAEEFAPAYYEDADLCARISDVGFRVVYDPSIVIQHHEYGSAHNLRTVEIRSAQARQLFVQRNRAYLRSRYLADPRAEVFARSTDAKRRRVLVIEDRVPLRALGSGFVRSNDLIRIMASLQIHVTVFPIFGGTFEPHSVYADFPDIVEIMYDKSLKDLSDFLASRDGYYDTIWVVRTHNLERVRPVLERSVIGRGNPPRIILDTEAIVTLREAARAGLAGCADTHDIAAAMNREFRSAAFIHRIVTVSHQEADELRHIGFEDVAVLGHVRDISLTRRPFDQRSGILFVGAIHDMDSPNLDGLCWFADEVLPFVEEELGWETRLTVAGYTAEQVSLDRFRHNSRITLLGAVVDTEPLYDSHRVFVAPTRYAAGAPYKVYEAASFGIPVVATELLRRQLGWASGREVLTSPTSDPRSFARHVVALYRDPALWLAVRDGAAGRIACENDRAGYIRTLASILVL
jgi:O-antigen biosynthesis protein